MGAVLKRLLQKIKNICLVDRLLFLFMCVFYLYMGIHLFTGTAALESSRPVDIIVRTSTAAIFGYFISASFSSSNAPTIKSTSTVQEPQSLSDEFDANQPTIQNKIGFQAEGKQTDSVSLSRSSTLTVLSSTDCGQQQVVVVAVFGFLSFFLLVFASHLTEQNENLSAIMSQLRDFVSASIGFLISCKSAPKT